MQSVLHGLTAAEAKAFLVSPGIALMVALTTLMIVKKIKPDFKPKVSRPVFVFMCIGLMLIMLIIVFRQIIIHGYR